MLLFLHMIILLLILFLLHFLIEFITYCFVKGSKIIGIMIKNIFFSD